MSEEYKQFNGLKSPLFQYKRRYILKLLSSNVEYRGVWKKVPFHASRKSGNRRRSVSLEFKRCKAITIKTTSK